MTTDITIDISGACAAAAGEKHGASPEELRELATRVRREHKVLREDRRTARYGFYDLYKDAQTFDVVEKTAAKFLARGYENLVVLGIGGSALGITALTTAIKGPYYNLMDSAARKGMPRLFVMDNVDPDTFDAMLALCPPENTLFNVISKSGETAETVAQLLVIVKRIEETLGAGAMKHHVVVTAGATTDNDRANALRFAQREYRLTAFDIPKNVGGRFSVFTPVGMFPAAMLGMDLKAFRDGCAAMDRRVSKADMDINPAYLRAALHYSAATKKGKSISVMMPYSDRLRDVADWYRQLWAESLGKNRDLEGRKVEVGQTPVKSLGVTDQHSQLQLYLDGPNDKLLTILEVDHYESRVAIPNVFRRVKGIEHLRKRSLNALFAAECTATRVTLVEAKRPTIRVTLPRVNEHSVAQLLYMLEVETAMAGRLFGVNAFDQPAVEAIKVRTRRELKKTRG
ncbi:MAG: glucose-6-phosphate isomerase [Candidatus Hydrogenedentota bacterium]